MHKLPQEHKYIEHIFPRRQTARILHTQQTKETPDYVNLSAPHCPFRQNRLPPYWILFLTCISRKTKQHLRASST